MLENVHPLILSKLRKISSENETYNDEIASKGEECELNWENAKKLKESFDQRNNILLPKRKKRSKRKKESKELPQMHGDEEQQEKDIRK